MTTDDKIRYERLQYDINREAAKVLALYQVKLTNISILQATKYYLPIKVE